MSSYDYNSEKNRVLGRRVAFLILLNLVAFAVIVARLYFLQIYEADKYRTMSEENRISTRFLVPPRGVVYDRNGIIIAKNEQDFRALLIAEQAPDIEQTLKNFEQIIPLTPDEEKKIRADIKNKRNFIPVKLKDNLSWDEVSKILLHAPDLAGVEIDEGLSRQYPYGDLYAHVLGYVGPVSEADKKSNPLYMVPGFKIGKSGLERYYDYKLQGSGGTVKLEVNAYGRVMKEIERDAGKQGDSITISIDSRLQKEAYEAFGEESGAAVVLDVRTGEINCAGGGTRKIDMGSRVVKEGTKITATYQVVETPNGKYFALQNVIFEDDDPEFTVFERRSEAGENWGGTFSSNSETSAETNAPAEQTAAEPEAPAEAESANVWA